MSAKLEVIGGARVLVVAADGSSVAGERDATDLIGRAFETDAEWIAVPMQRLGPDFFQLSTRIAGETIQKIINYRFRLAVVGDVSAEIAASQALRDFVYESNKGRHVWFVGDLAELERRLTT